MFKLFALLMIVVAVVACKPPVPVHEVDLFVTSKQISMVSVNAKPIDLTSSPERVYVLKLAEGKHVVSWTTAGTSIQSANFDVTGPGAILLLRPAPFIKGEEGVSVETPVAASGTTGSTSKK